jgi:DNA polymerase III sliding clamp (beta) subunit (PCNA family)
MNAILKLQPATLSAPISFLIEVLPVLIRHASTDDTRPQLGCILATCDAGGRLRLVATDGHRLIRVDSRVDGPCDGPETDILIPLASAKRALSAIKALSKWLRADGHAEITATGISYPGGGAAWDVVDEQFPPYAKVIPVDYLTRETTGHIGVRVAYLGDLASITGGSGAVRMHIGAPLDPIVLEVERPGLCEVLAVVMPMRV